MSQVVQFAFYDKQRTVRWRKLPPPEWSIVQTGRWGPRWLHRLVFRMATNLGMIRHPREATESIKIVTLDRRAQSDLFREMRAACLYGFDRYGFRPSAIKIVCGENEMAELAASPMLTRSLSFDLQGDWRDGRGMRVDGVLVKIVPGLKGWAVLPADV